MAGDVGAAPAGGKGLAVGVAAYARTERGQGCVIPKGAVFCRVVRRRLCASHSVMAPRLLLALFALTLACAGCSPPATLVKDGCDQDPDFAFRNQVIAAAPFTSAAEIEHDELILTVDPGQWRNLGYGMRQQLIAIIDCGDAGPGKYHTNIYVRQTSDGPDLMKASQGELVQWRADGLAILKQDGFRADVVATDAKVQTHSGTDPSAPVQ